MSDETPGFLARWSRRKRAAEDGTEAEDGAEHAAGSEGGVGVAPEMPPVERPACPIPTLPEIDLVSLPSIEELTAESDFSPFLRPGIPTGLRSAALRRMWSLDPAIRDYIGPADYQWDFNTTGGLPLGFANELVGDVAKLLAQAVGSVTEPKTEEAAGETAEAEETPPDPPASSELPMAALPDSTGDLPPESEPPPRRRHGSALPA